MKIKEAVVALAALAQESRLELFRLLVKTGPVGLCAGSLAEALGVPRPTMSFHLKELTRAGLIDFEKVGRSVVYRSSINGIQELMEFLVEDCCQGREELCFPQGKKRVNAATCC